MELYQLSKPVTLRSVERLANGLIRGTWRNIVKCRNQLEEFNIYPTDVIRRGVGDDSWISDFAPNGHFEVASLRNRIDRGSYPINDGFFLWSNIVPIKVSCFAWRARLGKIPSAVALCNRGVPMATTVCKFCQGNQESANHILVTCPIACQSWKVIFDWCGVPNFVCSTVREIIDLAHTRFSDEKKRKVLVGIIYGVLWSIWKSRNDLLFKDIKPSPEKIVSITKSSVFVWLKYRAKRGGLNWDAWCNSPLSWM